MSIKNCIIGENFNVNGPVNIYGCTIGDNVSVGPFVEIQKNVTIRNGTRINSHSFICEGVSIGENVFIAHGVMFVNDLISDWGDIYGDEWTLRRTIIKDNVRIGSNATILPVTIGCNVIIGAGAVVTKDVPDDCIVKGNPGIITRRVD